MLSSSQKTLLGLGHKNMILEEEVKSQRLRCALHWMLKYRELFASNKYDVTFGLQFLQLQVGNDMFVLLRLPPHWEAKTIKVLCLPSLAAEPYSSFE